jgi:hypothetical protein
VADKTAGDGTRLKRVQSTGLVAAGANSPMKEYQGSGMQGKVSFEDTSSGYVGDAVVTAPSGFRVIRVSSYVMLDQGASDDANAGDLKMDSGFWRTGQVWWTDAKSTLTTEFYAFDRWAGAMWPCNICWGSNDNQNFCYYVYADVCTN